MSDATQEMREAVGLVSSVQAAQREDAIIKALEAIAREVTRLDRRPQYCSCDKCI